MVSAIKKIIRVRKEDSAFVYFILESYEGVTSYSTLEFKPGDLHRDLELSIPPDFIEETQEILVRLGELIHELPGGTAEGEAADPGKSRSSF